MSKQQYDLSEFGGKPFVNSAAPIKQKSFDTALNPAEESQFKAWKTLYAPNDSGVDYDLRGAFKAGLKPDPKTGHWPDTFKKPNHPTFSTESQYAKDAPDKAGHWNGDVFVPPGQTTQTYDLSEFGGKPLSALPQLPQVPVPDKGTVSVDEAKAELDKHRLPAPPVSPTNPLYSTVEGIRHAASQAGDFIGGAAETMGYDPQHPILGTAVNMLTGISRLRDLADPSAIVRDPKQAFETAKGLAHVPVDLANDIGTVGTNTAKSVSELASPGSHPEALSESPESARAAGRVLANTGAVVGGIEALGGIPGEISGIPKSIADTRSLAADTLAKQKSVSALSSVINQGTQDTAGHLAATDVQPHFHQFIQESGVDPAKILPAKGDITTQIRGGTPAELAKLNDSLKKQFVVDGGKPEKFVPAQSVQMASAEGAIDSAHRPIANAVNAIRNISADTVKGNIVLDLTKLRNEALATTDTARAKGFQQAIDQIASGDGTVGSIDSVRQDWNRGMSKFYRGTPTQISDAALTQDGVWKDANNVVREHLYPFVEDHVQRAPDAPSLAEAGRTERNAIAARDGIFSGWLSQSNLSDAASIEKWSKYVLKGPESLVGGIHSPTTSILGAAKRALEFKSRQLPIGEFNDALRHGITPMRDFKPMDASALDIGKREHPLSPLGPYSPLPSVPLPIENAPSNPIPNSLPRPPIPAALSTAGENHLGPGYEAFRNKTGKSVTPKTTEGAAEVSKALGMKPYDADEMIQAHKDGDPSASLEIMADLLKDKKALTLADRIKLQNYIQMHNPYQ